MPLSESRNAGIPNMAAIPYGQLPFVSIKSAPFNAVGDGVTDDTNAVLSAVAFVNSVGGGIVFAPQGNYLITSTIILPAGVSIRGVGMGAGGGNSSRFRWSGAGFCIQAGNNASALSRGISVEDIGINITTTTGSGINLFAVSQCSVRNVYIEGQVGTTATIGVQIDGANVSAFFITLMNVVCNHIFKGFVHTTTGTTKPTQVTGIGCTAQCDSTAGSMGIDVQTVGGVGCGDGVTYLGGNMEQCLTGVNLTGAGTTIIGMRFENIQGTASDVTFSSTARNNQIFGGATIFTITDNSGGQTNQVVAVPKNMVTNTSQENHLDSLLVSALGQVQMMPNGTNIRLWGVKADATYAGRVVVQAGQGSTGTGGSYVLYGHSHATHPGDTVAGISAGSGGKFRVNSQALDDGADLFSVDATNGTKVFGKFGCNGQTPVAKVASGGQVATTAPTNVTPFGYTTSAQALDIITKLNTMQTALIAAGILS